MSFGSELVRALRPYPTAARYLVGVSGGRDSVALLHGLCAIGYRRLVVCHLDHGLRGRAAQADARFVERLAEKAGLPLETARIDVTARAKADKCSLETAAREARYEFFAEAAARQRCHWIFLGHHADDQVETVLFNLLRGTGPAGLAGMSVEKERTVGRRKLQIIRPLLAVWRTQIDEYLHAENLRWRNDGTNASPARSTRNRMRLEILPMLEQVMGRNVRTALWQAADVLGAEEAWIASLTKAEAPLPAQAPLAALVGKPVAQQRRMIRGWLQRARVPQVGYGEVELVRSLLDKEGGVAKINLPGDWHARRRAGVLFLDK